LISIEVIFSEIGFRSLVLLLKPLTLDVFGHILGYCKVNFLQIGFTLTFILIFEV